MQMPIYFHTNDGYLNMFVNCKEKRPNHYKSIDDRCMKMNPIEIQAKLNLRL